MTGKKFGGNRPLDEIKAAVKKNKWFWNQERYDGGSDYVTFQHNQHLVAYNTFNGTFVVEHNKKLYTERSTEMDKVKWYADLLEFIYKPKEKK